MDGDDARRIDADQDPELVREVERGAGESARSTSWDSRDERVPADDAAARDVSRERLEAELHAAEEAARAAASASWDDEHEVRISTARLSASASWSTGSDEGRDDEGASDVELPLSRAPRDLAVPRDSVVSGRRRAPARSRPWQRIGLAVASASVVAACALALGSMRGGWAVPWWPAVLAATLTTAWWLGRVASRQGSGRSGQIVYRPVNGILVAASGTLPPLALLAFLVLPEAGARRVEDLTNRLVRLVSMTVAAACFHAADLGSGIPLSNVQALWLLAAPVAFWATETLAIVVVQRVAAGSTPTDLGMWRPAVVARELGETATGLVVVVAGLINPVLCLVGVPLVAASASAVRELSRSRTADLDRKTGLLNEPAFTHLATRELQRAARTRTAVSLLMLDLDHLKRLNDTHGHLAGDVAIVGIAEQIARRMRSTDLACRFGGEEFIVLLPDTDLRGALALAERIRGDVAAYPVAGRDGVLVPISVSIGVAQWEPPSTLAELKQWADDALYDAKDQGRNRVMAASART